MFYYPCCPNSVKKIVAMALELIKELELFLSIQCILSLKTRMRKDAPVQLPVENLEEWDP